MLDVYILSNLKKIAKYVLWLVCKMNRNDCRIDLSDNKRLQDPQQFGRYHVRHVRVSGSKKVKLLSLLCR